MCLKTMVHMVRMLINYSALYQEENGGNTLAQGYHNTRFNVSLTETLIDYYRKYSQILLSSRL